MVENRKNEHRARSDAKHEEIECKCEGRRSGHCETFTKRIAIVFARSGGEVEVDLTSDGRGLCCIVAEIYRGWIGRYLRGCEFNCGVAGVSVEYGRGEIKNEGRNLFSSVRCGYGDTTSVECEWRDLFATIRSECRAVFTITERDCGICSQTSNVTGGGLSLVLSTRGGKSLATARLTRGTTFVIVRGGDSALTDRSGGSSMRTRGTLGGEMFAVGRGVMTW